MLFSFIENFVSIFQIYSSTFMISDVGRRGNDPILPNCSNSKGSSSLLDRCRMRRSHDEHHLQTHANLR